MTLLSYVSTLGGTLVIECAVAFAFGVRKKWHLAFVALASLISHPLLHIFLLLAYASGGRSLFFLFAGEIMVIFGEWLLLSSVLPFDRRRVFLIVATANLTSALGGFFLLSALQNSL